MSCVINVIGGFDKRSNIETHNKLIGDKFKQFLNSKTIEWESFKRIYFINGKIDKKYETNFLMFLSKLFILTDTDNIVDKLYKIYNEHDSYIVSNISNFLELINPLKEVLLHMFVIIKNYIEKLIEVYIILRERYILNIKKNKSNNFKKLVDEWYTYDIKHNIDTTSLILYFNCNSVKSNKLIWEIKCPNKEITKNIEKFTKEIKKFKYHGLCINAIIPRLLLLLDFPIDLLINMIIGIDTNNNFKNEIQLSKTQIIYMNKILSKIKIPKIPKIKKTTLINKINTNQSKRFKMYENYVKSFLSLYKQLLPFFKKKEKIICDIAQQVNKITIPIQNKINTIDKILKNMY